MAMTCFEAQSKLTDEDSTAILAAQQDGKPIGEAIDTVINDITLERTALAIKITKAGGNVDAYDDGSEPMFSDAGSDYETPTLKTLEAIKGKTTISKQFISDLARKPDVKQAERDAINTALAEITTKKVNVEEFIAKVQGELLPLTTLDVNNHENVTLSGDMRGDIDVYGEKVYISPIENSAGNVHYMGNNIMDYFAHVRYEDVGDTRRILEIQSDLYQQGREVPPALEIYRNTWFERVIREERKRAAQDGMTTLKFPTGETAAYIEGFADPQGNGGIEGEVEIGNAITWYGEDYTVVDVYGDGARVVPINDPENRSYGYDLAKDEDIDNFMEDIEYNIDNLETFYDSEVNIAHKQEVDGEIETFEEHLERVGQDSFVEDFNDEIREYVGENMLGYESIDDYVNNYLPDIGLAGAHREGTVYTYNADNAEYINTAELGEEYDYDSLADDHKVVVDFYQKQVTKYNKKLDKKMSLETDENGVSWYETDINEELADTPVLAYSKAKKKPATPQTTQQVINIVKRDPRLKSLYDADKIVILSEVKDLPLTDKQRERVSNTTEAMYINGKVYLVSKNLSDKTVSKVVWHELVHNALDTSGDTFLDEKVKASLFRRLDKQIEEGGDKELARAVERVKKAGVSEKNRLEETAAYLMNDYTDGVTMSDKLIKWVREFVAAIKAAIIKHTGVVGIVDAPLMKALAKSYADYYIAGQTNGVSSSYEIPNEAGRNDLLINEDKADLRDLFAPTGIPAETAKEQSSDNFFVSYKQVKSGEFKSGFDTVTTPEQVAHVVASIRKNAQETFIVVVTDDNGKILNVIRHTIGSKDSSIIRLSEVVGAIASTDGAANVWFAHNHPSGVTDPSMADFSITDKLVSSLDGLDVRFKGHVIVSPDSKDAAYFTRSTDTDYIPITPARRIKSIAITERVLRKVNKNIVEPMADAAALTAYVDNLDSENGLLLMNNKHTPVGVISLSPSEMGKLRDGKQVKRILSAFDKTNTAAVAVFVNEKHSMEALNLGNFIAKIDDLRHLDTILTGDNASVSLASQGKTLGDKGSQFFSVTDMSESAMQGQPLFSVKGTNSTWRDEKGTKGLSEKQFEAMGKVGQPPNRPMKERVAEKFNKSKQLWKTKFRQGTLDQYESINAVLGNKRAWMLAQMSGSAGGLVEMSLVAGQPYLHKDGVTKINEDKKSLSEIFKALGDEAQLFLLWVAGNRADAINKRSREADAKIATLKAEVSALKAQANEQEASTITIEGRADNKTLRKEAKKKEAEIKKLQKVANVKERLFSEEDIAELKNLNSNTRDDGSVWAEREAVYAQALKDFEEMHNAYIKIGVDTGLVSPLDAKVWREQGFYVPFYRLSDEEANEHGISSASGMIGQEAYKKMKGADMQLDDLLLNTVMNWNHLASASLKNQAGREALESAVQLGIATKLSHKKASKKQKNTKDVFIRVNGREVWYTIDDTPESKLVLQSISSLNYSGLNSDAMKLARKFKRALTYGVTASPEFKIANLIRDSIQAIAVGDMSTNVLANIAQGWKGTEKHKSGNIQAIAAGGLFGDSGYIHGNDPDAIKILLARGIDKTNILNTTLKVHNWWNNYQDLGARLENVNRLANIEQNIAKGQNLLEANFAGRDHLDFQRSGAYEAVRFLTQVTPFLNARMQGLDKMWRSLKDPKQRAQMTAVLISYAAASTLLYLYMKDDDDYKEAEDWERDTYHLIKLPGSDVMVRIPRPFEVGFIANMVERFVEQFVDPDVEKKVFFERLQHGITETLSFSLPQIIAPAIDIRANKSSFTGRSIESMSMQRLSPTNRIKPWTTQTAIGVSEAMSLVLPEDWEYSPIQVDYAVQNYLGWLGATVLDVVDLLARPMVGAPAKPSMQLKDYPLVGRFLRDAKGNNAKQISLLYDNRAMLNTAFSDIEQYKANGEIEKYRAEMKAAKGNLAMRKAYNKAGLRLSKLSNEVARVTKGNLSPEAKRDRINRINRRRIEIAKRVTERFKPTK